MIKRLVIAIGFLLLVAAIMVLRPVPIVAEHEALTESGIVSGIFEGGDKPFFTNRKVGEMRRYFSKINIVLFYLAMIIWNFASRMVAV